MPDKELKFWKHRTQRPLKGNAIVSKAKLEIREGNLMPKQFYKTEFCSQGQMWLRKKYTGGIPVVIGKWERMKRKMHLGADSLFIHPINNIIIFSEAK